MMPPIDRIEPEASGRWKQRVLALALGLVLALLVLIGLPALVFLWLMSGAPEAIERSILRNCETRLQELYAVALAYEGAHGSLPNAAGPDFFQALRGDVESAPKGADAHQGLRGTGLFSESGADFFRSFTFRDNHGFPVRLGDPERALAACGNCDEQGHFDVTHVLMADGTIRALSLSGMREQGLIAADADRLILGPDSPLPLLRELQP